MTENREVEEGFRGPCLEEGPQQVKENRGILANKRQRVKTRRHTGQQPGLPIGLLGVGSGALSRKEACPLLWPVCPEPGALQTSLSLPRNRDDPR